MSERRFTRSTASFLERSAVLTPASAKRRTNSKNDDYVYNSQCEKSYTKERSLKKIKQKSPKRRIVKAKRLLQKKTVQPDENYFKHTEKEEIGVLMKQRVLQEQNIDKDLSNIMEPNSKRSCNIKESVNNVLTINVDDYDNEDEVSHNLNQQVDESKEEIKFEPKRSSIESLFSITALKEPISPSTSNSELNNTFTKSPEYLQFDSSEEILHPATEDTPPPKRRTFELERSVNDISLLKSVSKNDSVRINPFPSDQQASSAFVKGNTFSKVTMRKRWVKTDTRISKFSPPWSGSSSSSECTPQKNSISVKKSKSLLKNVLNKDNNIKVGSSVKMPNFAAIHQRAFDRMENLSEYKQRKEERAKMLMSGRKPEDQKSNVKKSNKSTKKQLSFASDTIEKEKPSTYIPLPSTPIPKKKPVDISFKAQTPNITKEKVNPQPLIQTPKHKNPFDQVFKIATPNFKFTEEKGNKVIVFKGLVKKNVENGISKKSKIPTKNVALKNSDFKNGYCNNGSNLIRKTVSKKDELKNMVATKCPTKMNAENKRNIIKGVRSNRRFELLMGMRLGRGDF